MSVFESVRALQCSVCLARSSCFVASHNDWHCARANGVLIFLYMVNI